MSDDVAAAIAVAGGAVLPITVWVVCHKFQGPFGTHVGNPRAFGASGENVVADSSSHAGNEKPFRHTLSNGALASVTFQL